MTRACDPTERENELRALVYELLDAHADTVEIALDAHAIAVELALDAQAEAVEFIADGRGDRVWLASAEIRWAAHLDYLRALHRRGTELLARTAGAAAGPPRPAPMGNATGEPPSRRSRSRTR